MFLFLNVALSVLFLFKFFKKAIQSSFGDFENDQMRLMASQVAGLGWSEFCDF